MNKKKLVTIVSCLVLIALIGTTQVGAASLDDIVYAYGGNNLGIRNGTTLANVADYSGCGDVIDIDFLSDGKIVVLNTAGDLRIFNPDLTHHDSRYGWFANPVGIEVQSDDDIVISYGGSLNVRSSTFANKFDLANYFPGATDIDLRSNDDIVIWYDNGANQDYFSVRNGTTGGGVSDSAWTGVTAFAVQSNDYTVFSKDELWQGTWYDSMNIRKADWSNQAYQDGWRGTELMEVQPDDDVVFSRDNGTNWEINIRGASDLSSVAYMGEFSEITGLAIQSDGDVVQASGGYIGIRNGGDLSNQIETGISDVTVLGVYNVPEPATMTLLGIGALALIRRRKRA